jgi:hypothetical protein
MSDEGYITHVLDAHHAKQFAMFHIAPELDARVDFSPELVSGHIRFFPAIFRDDPSIGLGGLVDDLEDGLEVSVVTFTNHMSSPREKY